MAGEATWHLLTAVVPADAEVGEVGGLR